GRHEHQAADGSRLLSRVATSSRTTCARPTHPYQCPHPQGSGQADRRQEEVSPETIQNAAGVRLAAGQQAQSSGRPLPGSRRERIEMGKEATRVRRRERKNIASGVAHVNATFNNTMITITDAQGNTIAWSSAGTMGFKGS